MGNCADGDLPRTIPLSFRYVEAERIFQVYCQLYMNLILLDDSGHSEVES